MVFWAERTAPKEERIISLMFDPDLLKSDDLVDSELAGNIKSVFDSLMKGVKPATLDIDEDVKFDILGMSKSKTRLVIRFFYTNTFGGLVEKILNHYQDIYIDGNHGREFPSPYILVREAALMRENKNISPKAESELIRSILYGMPYPYGLYCEMLSRIRAEIGVDAKRNRGFAISRERAGFIKGYINRNIRFMNKNEKELMNVSLDVQQTNVGYVLGRLFALLEKAQKDALGKVNASIVDKYMNTALATPQYVFPMLLTLSKKHISKIGKQTTYETPYIEMQIGKVIDMLPATGFPKALNIENQGRFVVGYYHQNQALYESKKDKEE
jgi:CRISPR-associated protein Csd1